MQRLTIKDLLANNRLPELDQYLIIMRNLFRVQTVASLEGVKKQIDQLLTVICSKYDLSGQRGILSFYPPGLSMMLYRVSIVFYYEKKSKIVGELTNGEQQELSKEKNQLRDVPLPHPSYPAIANLIFTIVIVTLEMGKMPDIINHLSEDDIQARMMSMQAILMLVVEQVAQANQYQSLDADIRRGLACFLSRSVPAKNNMLDAYIGDIANILQGKLGTWFAHCHLKIAEIETKIKNRKINDCMEDVSRLNVWHSFKNGMEVYSNMMAIDNTEYIHNQLESQKKLMLIMDLENPADCENAYRKFIQKYCEDINKFEMSLHSFLNERATSEKNTLQRQRLIAGLMMTHYLQIYLLRHYLHVGYVRFNKDEVKQEFAVQLRHLSHLYAAMLLDAHPREEPALRNYSTLWAGIDAIGDFDDVKLLGMLDFCYEHGVMSSLLSVRLVANVRCYLTGRLPMLTNTSEGVLNACKRKIRCLLDIASEADVVSIVAKNVKPNAEIAKIVAESAARKQYIHCLLLDLYYVALKHCICQEEIDMLYGASWAHRIDSVIAENKYQPIYQFLFEAMKVLKSMNPEYSEFLPEYCKRLDMDTFNRLNELVRKAVLQFENEDETRINYQIRFDLAMYAAVFFKQDMKPNHQLMLKLGRHTENLLKQCHLFALASKPFEITATNPAKPKAPVQKKVVDEAVKAKNAASFLADTVTKKKVPAKATKKKGKQKPQPVQTTTVKPSVAKPTPPKPDSSFSAFETFYNKRYDAISSYLLTIIEAAPTALEKYYALVHLTDCVQKTKEQTLVVKLVECKDAIFREAKMFYGDEDEFKEKVEYVNSTLENLLPRKKVAAEPLPAVKVVTKSVVANRATAARTTVVPKANKASLFQPKQAVVPAKPPAAPTPPLVVQAAGQSFEKTIKKFKPLHQESSFEFPFSTAQRNILSMLKTRCHRTFVHGSSVLSMLFGVPVTDIDLLCYVDGFQLHKYLCEHTERYGIESSRWNENIKVVTIEFKAKDKNGEPEKMELLCRGKLTDDMKLTDMKNLLAAYFVGNMLADPYSGDLIDLHDQYLRIAKNRKFGCYSDGESASKYFESMPIRIIDLIIRVAYFKRHNISFGLTRSLKEGVEKCREMYACKGKSTIIWVNHIKWDKLFTRTHAAQSFAELEKHGLFDIIFPSFAAMNAEQKARVGELFSAYDRSIAEKYPHGLTEEQCSMERVELLSYLVICHLDIHGREASPEAIEEVLKDFNLVNLHRMLANVKNRVRKIKSEISESKLRFAM